MPTQKTAYRRPIWRRREEFGGRESEYSRTQIWFSHFLLARLPTATVGQTSFVRHTASRRRKRGDQIVPSFFCPLSFLPLRHPVSFCGSVTKTIWASGESERERERQGPFLPPCAAIKLNCRSGGEGFFLLGRLVISVNIILYIEGATIQPM